LEKDRQARRAVSRKTGKFSIPDLTSVEKTSEVYEPVFLSVPYFYAHNLALHINFQDNA